MIRFLLVSCLAALLSVFPVSAAEDLIKVLIVTGQNNHNWKKSSPILKAMLEKDGKFSVEVSMTPTNKAPMEAWDAWQPKFTDYQCVMLDYNGEMWPERVKKDFVEYVSNGGGVVTVHSSNNPFEGWKEYEQMVGLLWRGKDFGYSVYFDDKNMMVRENPGEGRRMGHGGQYDWVMTTRDPNHSITLGMPLHWMHKHDELYQGQRGSAENVHILISAYSDPAPGRSGTGKDEPIVWWVPYGKGKVVVNLMGHVGEPGCLQCAGFQTVTTRACEWVARGHCKTPIPADFPTAEKVSIRE